MFTKETTNFITYDNLSKNVQIIIGYVDDLANSPCEAATLFLLQHP
jgi:hypothetical protein